MCLNCWNAYPIYILAVFDPVFSEFCEKFGFDYLLEPWATKLPMDYPSSLLFQLQPYRQSYEMGSDGAIAQLAQELYQDVQGETIPAGDNSQTGGHVSVDSLS